MRWKMPPEWVLEDVGACLVLRHPNGWATRQTLAYLLTGIFLSVITFGVITSIGLAAGIRDGAMVASLGLIVFGIWMTLCALACVPSVLGRRRQYRFHTTLRVLLGSGG